MKNGRLHLEAIVAHPDGSQVLRESRDGDDPVKLGDAVGETLLTAVVTSSSKKSTERVLPCPANRSLARSQIYRPERLN